MENIDIPFDKVKLKQILIREGADFSLNYEENKEYFKEFFLKKYKKRILKRTRIRKKLLQN
tara:strand:+ start:560 stop:742 length:183 start_codon:yes stop_codon:yes gene_type:complete